MNQEAHIMNHESSGFKSLSVYFEYIDWLLKCDKAFAKIGKYCKENIV